LAKGVRNEHALRKKNTELFHKRVPFAVARKKARGEEPAVSRREGSRGVFGPTHKKPPKKNNRPRREKKLETAGGDAMMNDLVSPLKLNRRAVKHNATGGVYARKIETSRGQASQKTMGQREIRKLLAARMVTGGRRINAI